MDTQVFTMELSSVLPIKASLYIHGFYTNNQLTFLSGQENKDHTVNGTGLDTSTKSNHCPNNITVDPPIFQIQSQFLTFLALHAQLLVAPWSTFGHGHLLAICHPSARTFHLVTL